MVQDINNLERFNVYHISQYIVYDCNPLKPSINGFNALRYIVQDYNNLNSEYSIPDMLLHCTGPQISVTIQCFLCSSVRCTKYHNNLGCFNPFRYAHQYVKYGHASLKPFNAFNALQYIVQDIATT